MMVVAVTAVLMSIMFVVHVSLAYYARQVLAGAVHDGAAAGARVDATANDGAALTEELIAGAGGTLLTAHDVTATGDGATVTVTAHATVMSVWPLFPTIHVTATGRASVETFRSQGNR